MLYISVESFQFRIDIISVSSGHPHVGGEFTHAIKQWLRFKFATAIATVGLALK